MNSIIEAKKAAATPEELKMIEPKKQYELSEFIGKQLTNFEIKVNYLESFSRYIRSYNKFLSMIDKSLFIKVVDGLKVDLIDKRLGEEAEKPFLKEVGLNLWYDMGVEGDVMDHFPFIGRTPTKELLAGSIALKDEIKGLNEKFTKLKDEKVKAFKELVTKYKESEFTEPYIAVVGTSKCQVSYKMKKEGDVTVYERDAEGNKVEDKEAFEQCEKEWEAEQIKQIKEGLKEEDDAVAKAAFDEAKEKEAKARDEMARKPQDPNAGMGQPDPPLAPTDKVILQAFIDIYDAYASLAEEYREIKNGHEDELGKYLKMIGMGKDEKVGDLEDFMRRRRSTVAHKISNFVKFMMKRSHFNNSDADKLNSEFNAFLEGKSKKFKYSYNNSKKSIERHLYCKWFAKRN